MIKQKEGWVCKGKNCLIKHIKSHKRIYLRGVGILGTAGIIKMIIAIIAIAGAGLINPIQIPGKEEEMLLIFYKIEDIAHQRQNIINQLGYKMPSEEEFLSTEKEFHITQDLYKKYQLAQKLDKIIHAQDAFLEKKGYIDPEKDKQFDELEAKFDKLE